MTNDVLEQIAEDYFRSKGYFTQHNVKYRPQVVDKKSSVHSDIDVLGIHGTNSSDVIVVSCKSYQSGLKIKRDLKIFEQDPSTIVSGREHWKTFRELMNKTWAEALKEQVQKLTGKTTFTFYLVVTHYEKSDRALWESFSLFSENLQGCKIKLLDMEEMVTSLYSSLNTTPAHSELSRLLQLIKAGGGKVVYS